MSLRSDDEILMKYKGKVYRRADIVDEMTLCEEYFAAQSEFFQQRFACDLLMWKHDNFHALDHVFHPKEVEKLIEELEEAFERINEILVALPNRVGFVFGMPFQKNGKLDDDTEIGINSDLQSLMVEILRQLRGWPDYEFTEPQRCQLNLFEVAGKFNEPMAKSVVQSGQAVKHTEVIEELTQYWVSAGNEVTGTSPRRARYSANYLKQLLPYHAYLRKCLDHIGIHNDLADVFANHKKHRGKLSLISYAEFGSK